MAKLKCWKKESDRYGITVWRNTKNPKLTIEIVSFESQDMDEDEYSGWGYGYHAIDGKGVPHTPDFFESKKDAINWATNWMKNHPSGEY